MRPTAILRERAADVHEPAPHPDRIIQVQEVAGVDGLVDFHTLTARVRMLLAQAPLTLTILVITTLLILVPRPDLYSDPMYSWGMVCVLLLTVLAAALPWERLPLQARWTIPLLDFIPVALIWNVVGTELYGVSMLLAFPVAWLTWSGRRPVWAIVLSVVGSALVVCVPLVTGTVPDPRQYMLTVMTVPVMMFALALSSSVQARSMDRQRRQIEHALTSAAQQNRMLNTVLETADTGIVVTDRHGNDLIMNSAQRRTHQMALPAGVDDAPEADLLIYEPDGTTVIPPEDRPVRRAVQGESFTSRLVLLGEGASQQALSVSAQPMMDENGDFDGTVVVFHDVTDMTDAVRLREQFMANISHELRTPLTSIIGYSDLLMEIESDPQVKALAGPVLRNGERLLTLVDGLLDSVASAAEVTSEQTDMVTLLRLSVESAQLRADSAQVRLNTDLPATLPARVDPVKMAQVADNLISNAVKYTLPGGAVTVRARQDGPCVEFDVEDTGIGMTPAEQSKLFTNFYRTEHVRRAAIPGTGLGLAISRSLVRAHGGDITVESRAGEGSRFTVRFRRDGQLKV
ncbi:sensor histidine kinase [Micrococcus terreus]|uniref:sensor histidine kinase n=1 Tax=Micrococcus terreus TaxID=574650 RepID=UPI003D749F7B